MSLVRLIVWTCLIGGWSAFLSWFLTEVAFHSWIDQDTKLAIALAIVMGTFVAIAIGGGVSLASGLTDPKIPNLVKRLVLGFAGGLVGGLVASLLGACVFYMFEKVPFLGFVGRVFGWTLTGLAVGSIEGALGRDMNKLRNGLIGGGVGGFLAGFFFLPVNWIIGSPMSSRAFAFVLLGLFIGFFIGLAQVVLKQAWLTVEAGFRPGRQMILGQDLITMGTSEKASVIFIAYGAKGVEPIHLKISKTPDGRYLLEDNQSRSGTLVNGQPITVPTVLCDGDAIQLGVNVVRFNERASRGAGLPPPVLAQQPKVSEAITAKTPAPAPVSPIQAAPPKAQPPAAIQPAKPTPAPPQAPTPPKPAQAKPAPTAPSMEIPQKSKPAPAQNQPQEGRCPICDKKIVGIPGERRCGKCFTTF